MFGSDHTELVFAFVASIGADLAIPEQALAKKLRSFGYKVEFISVSRDVLPKFEPSLTRLKDSAERKSRLMDAGNRARSGKDNEDVLACGVAAEIARRRSRDAGFRERTAYIVHSLKHPAEVRRLWQLYPRGFYLVAMNVPWEDRKANLMRKYRLRGPAAVKLMERDRTEDDECGQNVLETFHLADFFVGWSKKQAQIIQSVNRFADLVFGHVHLTPTFGEHAMFMAFAAATRSADLSRQVGAVVTRHDEILANGANDCPRKGGGLYWPEFQPATFTFADAAAGRDHTRGKDSNRAIQQKIIRDIIRSCRDLTGKLKDKTRAQPLLDADGLNQIKTVLGDSPIKDLTEFGRVVHAEMESLLSCARRGIPTVDATLYCTTFPCHNCAKHIIAAGIAKVVFIEPYDKSLALDLHKEAIKVSYPRPRGAGEKRKPSDKVLFEPFFGVGPRRFLDLFSLKLSGGEKISRKDKQGKVATWSRDRPRVKMRPESYLKAEQLAAERFNDVLAEVRPAV